MSILDRMPWPRRWIRRALLAACAALLAVGLLACSQRYIEFTLSNQSDAQLRTVEVDYPGGSFGATMLNPGQVFHYRFKPLRSGTLVLIYDDARVEKKSAGPALEQGRGGAIEVTIGAHGVAWKGP